MMVRWERDGSLLSNSVYTLDFFLFILFYFFSLIQHPLSFSPSVLSWERWLMGQWPGPFIVAVSAVDLFSL